MAPIIPILQAGARAVAAFVPRLLVRGAAVSAIPKAVYAAVRTRLASISGPLTKTSFAVAVWELVSWALGSARGWLKDDTLDALRSALSSRASEVPWAADAEALAKQIRGYATDPGRKALVLDAMTDAGIGFSTDLEPGALAALTSAVNAESDTSSILFARDVTRLNADTPGGTVVTERNRAVLRTLEEFCGRTGLKWRDVRDLQILMATCADEHWNHLRAEEEYRRSRRTSFSSTF